MQNFLTFLAVFFFSAYLNAYEINNYEDSDEESFFLDYNEKREEKGDYYKQKEVHWPSKKEDTIQDKIINNY